MENNNIITRMQQEIDAANVECVRLAAALKHEQGVIGRMMGERAAVEAKGLAGPAAVSQAPADTRAAFKKYFSDDGQSPKAIETNGDGGFKLMSAASAWRTWEACSNALATATPAAPAEPMDEVFMLKREIHNLKRHIEDYCREAPPCQDLQIVHDVLHKVRAMVSSNDHAFIEIGTAMASVRALIDGNFHAAPADAGIRSAKITGWTDLAGTKPPDGEHVLIALDTGAVVTGLRFSAGWHWDETDSEADFDAQATHWMLLPTAPNAIMKGPK